MGSKISLVNKTKANLHICLKQLAPLYFENYLAPDQVFERQVGKVWFTIEARLAYNRNEYTTTGNVTRTALSSVAIVTTAAIVATIALESIPVLAVSAAVTSATGAIRAHSSGISGFLSEAGSVFATGLEYIVVSSLGWYLGKDRRIEIRAKVNSEAFVDQQEGLGVIDGQQGMIEFYLVEVCPNCHQEIDGNCLNC